MKALALRAVLLVMLSTLPAQAGERIHWQLTGTNQVSGKAFTQELPAIDINFRNGNWDCAIDAPVQGLRSLACRNRVTTQLVSSYTACGDISSSGVSPVLSINGNDYVLSCWK